MAPHATFYDIDTTGDPTWTGNYILKGTHRVWAPIRNEHDDATSVMKFTGRVSLDDVTIDCGAGSNNGVIITGANSKGARLRHTYFECENVTGAQTALEISGGTEYARTEDVKIHGVQAHTTGLLLDNCKLSRFENVDLHECLTGMKITNVASDNNIFLRFLLHTCTLGMDLDGGNGQTFDEINFHECTRNVDDEVRDHNWLNIHGHFPIYIYPDNFTGITVASDAVADTWGNLVDIVAANAIDNPFRIVGVHLVPVTSQLSRVRFTAVNGAPYYDDLLFDASKREGLAAPSGTEFIFNADTRIEAQAKVIGAGPDNIGVWVEVQEI